MRLQCQEAASQSVSRRKVSLGLGTFVFEDGPKHMDGANCSTKVE